METHYYYRTDPPGKLDASYIRDRPTISSLPTCRLYPRVYRDMDLWRGQKDLPQLRPDVGRDVLVGLTEKEERTNEENGRIFNRSDAGGN